MSGLGFAAGIIGDERVKLLTAEQHPLQSTCSGSGNNKAMCGDAIRDGRGRKPSLGCYNCYDPSLSGSRTAVGTGSLIGMIGRGEQRKTNLVQP